MNGNVLIFCLGILVIACCWLLAINVTDISNIQSLAEGINAFTAPIIAVFAALLVYISFREQVKANRIQYQSISEQRELDLSYRFYEELKTDLQRMQNEYGTKYQLPGMLEGFMTYVKDDRYAPLKAPLSLSHLKVKISSCNCYPVGMWETRPGPLAGGGVFHISTGTQLV